MSNVLSSKTVKTRKDHICWGCDKIYPPGSYMGCVSQADEGTVWTVYWCQICTEYISRSRYWDHNDVYGRGEIISNNPEGWNELAAEFCSYDAKEAE